MEKKGKSENATNKKRTPQSTTKQKMSELLPNEKRKFRSFQSFSEWFVIRLYLAGLCLGGEKEFPGSTPLAVRSFPRSLFWKRKDEKTWRKKEMLVLDSCGDSNTHTSVVVRNGVPTLFPTNHWIRHHPCDDESGISDLLRQDCNGPLYSG
mmetsp:Transcript_34272/g.79070  ORF Transcript_34272/g.79070 Transcript_34272/m.79070 type:complete len:151 (+) Transcript_34272:1068-1520(+)